MRATHGLRRLIPILSAPNGERLAIGLLAGIAAMHAPAAAARAEEAVRFDIPAQNLAGALDQYARRLGIQILYPYRIAATRRAPELHGTMSARAAIDRLLRGSGLEVVRFADHIVILRAARPAMPPRRPAPRSAVRGPAPAPSPPPPPVEIVVTGRAIDAPLDDAEISYAMTRIDADTLAQKRSASTAELFKQIPGFWVEATGGEASNNVRSRGIPTDGYSSVALLEDGLPVQYDGGLGYLNTDQVFRPDATIDRVEAVRGGPSAIFAPNAPGGSVDFLTRSGLRDPGLTLSATLGSFAYRRVDAFAGARVAPGLGLSLGGFYRADDGLRDPGYPADRGGQLRAGIDYDDGPLRLSFNVKRLDDRVILYLPVPLQFGDAGEVRGIAGFDPLFDTLAGPGNVHVAFKTPAGVHDFDLSEGTRSRITSYTLAGRLALDERSALQLRARLRTGSTLRNGLFPIGRPEGADDYLVGIWPALAAAFPGATTAEVRYAGTGAAFGPDSNGNGLVVGANLLSVRLPMDEFIGDARLTSGFDKWGRHDVALGATFAGNRLGFGREMGTVLLDVRGQARRLDVVALDAAGRQVGALTDNGFLRYGSLFDAATIRSSNIAFYAADEWQVAPRWRIDLGARWEHVGIGGAVGASRAFDLGDAATLADDNVLAGTGIDQAIDRDFEGFSWTAGVNFRPASGTGLFARLTHIARLPSATEFSALPDRTGIAVVPITMAEAGIVVARRGWNLSAVVFRTHFARLPFIDHRFDPVSNAYVDRTSIADTSTTGVELAGQAQLPGPLRLDVQATLQNPRYRNFSYVALVGGVPVAYDVSGNQLIRVPRLAMRMTPGLDLLAGKLRIGVEFVHYSSRFADIANSQRLPPFSLVNVNLNAKLSKRLALALEGTNLTNTLGLTEGNPRAGSFDAGGMAGRYFLARPEFGRTVRATLRFSL